MGIVGILGKTALAPVKVVTYPIVHPFKTIRVISYPVRHPFQTLMVAGLALYGLSYCSVPEPVPEKEPSQLEQNVESGRMDVQEDITVKLHSMGTDYENQRAYRNN